MHSKRSPKLDTVLFNLVLPSLEAAAHTFRALESCWHAREGLPCCPGTSCGSSGAANGRADEEYQVRARYQVRTNTLLVADSGLTLNLTPAGTRTPWARRRCLINATKKQRADWQWLFWGGGTNLMGYPEMEGVRNTGVTLTLKGLTRGVRNTGLTLTLNPSVSNSFHLPPPACLCSYSHALVAPLPH